MLNQITWLALSQQTRIDLSSILNIPKNGGVEVAGGVVVSDGHLAKDLAKIDTEFLQKFLNTKEENFEKMFKQVVEMTEKARKNINAKEKIISIGTFETLEPMKEEPTEQTSKQVEVESTESVISDIESELPAVPEIITNEEIAPAELVAEETVGATERFCQYCDSKGFRHTKACTRPQ